jgi:hypothetical protein
MPNFQVTTPGGFLRIDGADVYLNNFDDDQQGKGR